VPILTQQTGDHLHHGQLIIDQQNFGHRAEPNSTHSAGQASSAIAAEMPVPKDIERPK
jgi:hypothetical protein